MNLSVPDRAQAAASSTTSMSSTNVVADGSPSGGFCSAQESPVATLRAPGDKALSGKSYAESKQALEDLFLAPKFFVLADLLSSDKGDHGMPLTLLHSVMRIVFGAHGVDWEAFLPGGMFGKIISKSLQKRCDAKEKPPAQGKVLLICCLQVCALWWNLGLQYRFMYRLPQLLECCDACSGFGGSPYFRNRLLGALSWFSFV